MKEYKAPQKEFSFILDELIDYTQHSKMPGFEDAGRDVVDAIIPEAAKFYEDIVAPTNFSSDKEGTLFSNGAVVTASPKPTPANVNVERWYFPYCDLFENPGAFATA